MTTLGGIIDAVVVARAPKHADLLASGWFWLGIAAIFLGLLALLWSLVLVVAHHHAERLIAVERARGDGARSDLDRSIHDRDRLAKEGERYREQTEALREELSIARAKAVENENPIMKKVFVETTVTTPMLIRMVTDKEKGNNRLVGYEFTDCTFPGPAMMAFPGSSVNLCIWAHPKAIPIELDADLTGAVVFVSCQFLRCRFDAITPLVPVNNMGDWASGFTT
jgi:hypothetical protein